MMRIQTSRSLGLALALFAATATASAREGYPVTAEGLLPAAAELKLRWGKRTVEAGSVAEKLPGNVRAVLNAFAPLATEHELEVLVPVEAPAVIFGTADLGTLKDVSGWMDEAYDLIGDAFTPEQEHRAVAAFIVEDDALETESYHALLADLHAKQIMPDPVFEGMSQGLGGITLRSDAVFLQPVGALIEDAEYSFENEVGHKYAQCLLTARFGQVPEKLRWGMGFVVEQRLFESIFQFSGGGFVSTADHHQWPDKTRDFLEDIDEDEFSLVDLAAVDEEAGLARPAQMITWGALDYLCVEDPASLRAMLDALAALHREHDELGVQPRFQGDPDRAREVLAEHLDGIEARKLAKHLKKVR